MVGDSSFALVANHDSPTLCSRLSFGELLQTKDYAINQIRTVYPGLKWGKGLSAINHQMWELIEKVERENRLQDRSTPYFGRRWLGWKRRARRLWLSRLHVDPPDELDEVRR